MAKEDLKFDGSVKVNKKGQAILGKLSGPVAEFIAPTRNGRMYDEETWDKVFKKPLVKEMFEAGGLLGELNHPEDRVETDLSKVCVCMPEPPKKNKDGTLTATFDILDTPNGRIVATLAKYGYKLGVSSRADGDTYTGYDNVDHVDPDTFDLKGFDIVLLPAVKKARLEMTESLNCRAALKKQLDEASPKDRKVMTESLNTLGISLQSNNTGAVANNKAVTELQNALKANRELKQQVKGLQEQLSVCYTKENEQKATIDKYERSVKILGKGVSQARALDEQLETLEAQNNQLREDLSRKEKLNEELQHKVDKLTETAKKAKAVLTKVKAQQSTALTESYKKSEEDLKKSKALTEQYKKIAQQGIDKYIHIKALMLGVTDNAIKSRLTENYSYEQIDRICENLQPYKSDIAVLPPDLKNSKVKVTGSKELIRPQALMADDEVDASLLRMIGE